jgi:integrase
MPRKLPRYVDLQRSRHDGRPYYYFRKGKCRRTPLPGSPGDDEFEAAYAAALANAATAPKKPPTGRTIEALIDDYQRGSVFRNLRDTTKAGYRSRLRLLRKLHGHRTVSGMTRDGIEKAVLSPYADRPGQALAILKILRVLIRHAIAIHWITTDPSAGIKRPKGREIRAWTEAEVGQFEALWPVGTKQRLAFAIMLHAGTARADVHRITWKQLEAGGVTYTRSKTGVEIDIGADRELQKILSVVPRDHVCVLTTAYGKPFTVSGFSNFMRAAIATAGLPLDCRPHGLRKTLGRRLADAGATAHEIMAVLGHTTLAEAERYTREADRRLGGRQAIIRLETHRQNRNTQTAQPSLGKTERK